jgi:hypothetical protein
VPTIINYKNLADNSSISPGFQATLITSYTAPPIANYVFEFSNIDGKVSSSETVDPSGETATFWYLPAGGNGGPAAVTAWGFDATEDLVAQIEFTVTPQAGPVGQIASGDPILTGAAGVRVEPPAGDGVPQNHGYKPSTFQYWFDISTGLISSMAGSTLALTQNESGYFLAVYSASLLQYTPNCTDLINALNTAAEVLEWAKRPTSHQTPEQIQSYTQIWTEAFQAAEPCLGKSAASPPPKRLRKKG